MFRPTRTLLHTYNHHDHDHHHHDHDDDDHHHQHQRQRQHHHIHHHTHHHIHHHHHQHQYVERSNSINFIFMRDQYSPPSLNNMLIGVMTSTYLHEGTPTYLMMMMMIHVHFDIPLLGNIKNMQPCHESGAEQHQGCTEHVLTAKKYSDIQRLTMQNSQLHGILLGLKHQLSEIIVFYGNYSRGTN